jgi:hypothetical protein
MTDCERTITLVYEGRRLEVSIEFFSHLVNCGSNYANEMIDALKEKPLDWDSPHAELEFSNRRVSIEFDRETVELARRIRDFLKGDQQ